MGAARGARLTSDLDDIDRGAARAAILEAIAKLAPEVLEDLRDRVLPLYAEVARQLAGPGRRSPRRRADRAARVIAAALGERWAEAAYWLGWVPRATPDLVEAMRQRDCEAELRLTAEVEAALADDARRHLAGPHRPPPPLHERVRTALGLPALRRPPGLDPGVGPLRERLTAWAERWRLRAPWLLEHAVLTLRDWTCTPPVPGRDLRFAPLWYGALSPVAEAEQVQWVPLWWDPAAESWAEAAPRIKKRFDETLAEFRARVEARALAPARGKGTWTPSHEARQAARAEWFVRFQVQGWPVARIAREYAKDRHTVRDTVLTVARLAGFTPRADRARGGRPRRPA